MKKTLPLIAIFVPVLVMAAWIGYHFSLRGAPTVILDIQGYDPRDLLSGHYLIYQVDYGERGQCKNVTQPKDGRLCVCLDGARPAKATWMGRCDYLPRDCPVFLRGSCKGGRFEAGIERFYFSENYTQKLKVVPARSTIEVKVSDGHGQVSNFFIDGVPWREALNQASQEESRP